MTGFLTLFYKELLRFWRVGFQTVAAPILTSLLYLLIFAHALEGRVKIYDNISYSAFLVPGLVMMSVLQNAFANSSSSLIQSKVTGNIVFMLLPPISYLEFFGAYVLASVTRGIVVGLGVLVVTVWFVDLTVEAPPLDIGVCTVWQRDSRCAGTGCRHLGRQIRSARRISEFRHHAADFPVGRVLLDSFPAAFLAGCFSVESVFLHDRRISVRFFRRIRCLSGDQYLRGRRVLRGALGAYAGAPQVRL